jgi:hypothetical protein
LFTTRTTGKPRLERLAEDEPRLGQGPLARIHEEEHTIDHRQTTLDLAPEVGVAGRVDDVHLRVADLDGGVLGEDRDALLALEVHRVHDALGHVLVVAERAGLPEQASTSVVLPWSTCATIATFSQVVAAPREESRAGTRLRLTAVLSAACLAISRSR